MKVSVKNSHFVCPELEESDGVYIDCIVRCLRCGKIALAESEPYPTCIGPFAIYSLECIQDSEGMQVYPNEE